MIDIQSSTTGHPCTRFIKEYSFHPIMDTQANLFRYLNQQETDSSQTIAYPLVDGAKKTRKYTNESLIVQETIKREEKNIINLYKNTEFTIRKIAKKFNCSVYPIRKILVKNNIKIVRKPFTKEWKNKIRETKEKLFKEGKLKTTALILNEKEIIDLYVNKKWSKDRIGRLFDCSFQPINRILIKNDISIRKSSPHSEEDCKKLSLAKKGKPNPKNSIIRKKMYKEGKLPHFVATQWKTNHTSLIKGKTFEEFYGKEKANELIRKMSEKFKELFKDPTKNPNWRGGISFEPYSPEFNDTLKDEIRKRDEYVCQECNQHQDKLNYRLPIHHIDYNKKNNSPNNLISLCIVCHVKTNYGREYWKEYYQSKILQKITQFTNQ